MEGFDLGTMKLKTQPLTVGGVRGGGGARVVVRNEPPAFWG